MIRSSQKQDGKDIRPQQSGHTIDLCNVQVRYEKEAPLVLDLNRLSIKWGECVALIGPSGAGKTTLLRLINGYVKPTTISYMDILGERVNPRAMRHREFRRRIGFIFQQFNLVERATVFENVLWGRLGHAHPLWSLLGWFSETDKQAAMKAISEVDLLQQAKQRADTLSGGQQQRVAIARVLAQEAEIILADEPVSNLDPALADEIIELLSEVSKRRGATLVMSVHQPQLGKRHAERIIGLREGKVVYDNKPDALTRSDLQTIYDRDVILDSNDSIETEVIPSI